MHIEQILGDYRRFYHTVAEGLSQLDISIEGLQLSHLGYKTASIESYNRLREQLLALSAEYLENVHNGRPILKAVLIEPLMLAENTTVSLIELMPPKPGKHYDDGLEHLGVVVGKELPGFVERHRQIITEVQDQGPYCKPACILLDNGMRTKFYEYPLRHAIEMEGQTFQNNL